MPKNSRSKGKRGERQAAKLLEAWWGAKFTSTPSSGGFQTAEFRADWNAAGDVVTPDPTFPFCVEVKNAEGWHLEHLLTRDNSLLHQWWWQTVDETPEDKISLLLFSRNHQPWFFMIYEPDAIWAGIDIPHIRSPLHTTAVWIGLFTDFASVDPLVWRTYGESLSPARGDACVGPGTTAEVRETNRSKDDIAW